ncbi:MAG: hypothetical protein COV48_11900, partial [Elusimicrobia bacterium CG11_big_fil_rev_8_21_14_0_20_64_6]
MTEQRQPYQQSVDETLAELSSSPSGLSAEEAAARLSSHGANELVEKAKRTLLAMFLDQFK